MVELGPGTGAITNALVEHGIDQKRLVLVEYNPGFCALLRDRYPQAKVVLTVRDPDQWYESASNTIFRTRQDDGGLEPIRFR